MILYNVMFWKQSFEVQVYLYIFTATVTISVHNEKSFKLFTKVTFSL